MKRLIRNVCTVVSLLSLVMTFSIKVFGEEGSEEPYTETTYEVKYVAGDYGTITNNSAKTDIDSDSNAVTLEYSYLEANAIGDIDIEVPSDSKYYFKGFHVSGIEIEGSGESAEAKYKTKIDEDIVYVASYGIKGDTMAYTVNYVNQAGQPLRGAVTYYGNVGDKPVVAFRYIDGYLPNAYTLTGTLGDPSKPKDDPGYGVNTFTFTYYPFEPTEGEGGTIVTYVDEGGTITYITVPAAGGGAVAPAGGGAGPGGGGVAPAGGGGAGPAVIPDDQTPAGGPEEIIDIDEPETPSGNFSPAPTATATTIPEPGTPGGGLSNAWKIALATGGGIGLLLLLLLLLRRKDNAE